MDAILRAVAIYVFLLIIFRISGRRTFSEITTFDFVLLLIIGEATQQGLLGDDFSVTNAFLIISTLIIIDIGLSLFKRYVPASGKILDGVPMLLVEDGEPLHERMKKARVNEYDIMEAARRSQGLERMDQIKYAVLEVSGTISIVPKPKE
ncbi:conserved hypothetical membrane-anchored protein [Parvibaculum lavamentivorans DS-1]|uniref:Conserved hypothetical membrane-anchored protein n=1 Tax=Parvibaculum lavamentivorans (strain DS-1 / DSM 13023 / NCIMB 13966) TaxID=402881 RepID=A7HYA9_PARL1|nr:YetF domain-containing protein [Parvibaculum lavamentivorans]ABS64892.1 conserved hypothetical membrane-anchored protein [Parvibaculum lavamentivorans DS-1]